VERVGVFLDVEVLLHLAACVGQECPLGADRAAELIGLENVVGRDRHDLGVGDGDLRVVSGQLEMLLMLLWAEMAAREDEDHRIDALQLA
jgi:hypothetical protein